MPGSTPRSNSLLLLVRNGRVESTFSVSTGRVGFETPTGRFRILRQERGVVSTAYRRGISRFIVTTRLVGPNLSAWSDPLFANENVAAAGRPVRFTGGALQGQTGELVVTPGSVPHLWTAGERLVVTVSGDLTEAELMRVASSLRP